MFGVLQLSVLQNSAVTSAPDLPLPLAWFSNLFVVSMLHARVCSGRAQNRVKWRWSLTLPKQRQSLTPLNPLPPVNCKTCRFCNWLYFLYHSLPLLNPTCFAAICLCLANASSTSVVNWSLYGTPACSMSLGNMLMLVKPGIVFISLR